MYGFLWLVSVYGQKLIFGRIYGFFLTRFGYYPPPPPLHFRVRGFYEKKKIFGRIYIFFRTEFGYYTTPPQTLDFLELRVRRVKLFGCAE